MPPVKRRSANWISGRAKPDALVSSVWSGELTAAKDPSTRVAVRGWSKDSAVFAAILEHGRKRLLRSLDVAVAAIINAVEKGATGQDKLNVGSGA